MPVLPSLNRSRHDRGHHTTITLAGEIDLDAAPALRVMVEDCLRDGIRRINIDLAAVGFCDISGLNVFLAAAERTTSQKSSLRLHRPRPQMARLLDLSGTGFLLRAPHPAPTRPLVPGSLTTDHCAPRAAGLMTSPQTTTPGTPRAHTGARSGAG
jgi:anti-sigma B factor antagonist